MIIILFRTEGIYFDASSNCLRDVIDLSGIFHCYTLAYMVNKILENTWYLRPTTENFIRFIMKMILLITLLQCMFDYCFLIRKTKFHSQSLETKVRYDRRSARIVSNNFCCFATQGYRRENTEIPVSSRNTPGTRTR